MILEDILKSGLDLVVCGTAVGNKSADVENYYAGRGNKFYSILYRLNLTPRRFEPKEDINLLQHQIGLTDLVKTKSGNDKVLVKEHFDISGFIEKIQKFQPKVVCFNGKAAAAAFVFSNHKKTKWIRYGLLDQQIGKTKLFVAPSTSNSANKVWDESFWYELAALISLLKEQQCEISCEYKLPTGLTGFQTELYIHLIEWKWKNITSEVGVHMKKDSKGILRVYEYDAILPESVQKQFPVLYPSVLPEIMQHQELFNFKFHKHFHHMASSQVANMNLFLPILTHPRVDEVFCRMKNDFKSLAKKEFYKGFRIEYWDGNTTKEKGLLGDHTPNAGTDADIAIAYFNHEDQLCLWLIEHKLTEKEFTECGGAKSPGRKKTPKCDCSRSFADIIADNDLCYYHHKCGYEYWNLTERNQAFFLNHNEFASCPFRGGMNQLWRNQLLGFAVKKQGKFSKVTFSVVKHPRNHDLDNTIKEYQKLTDNNPGFSVLSSKSFVDAARNLGDIEFNEWADWYCELYNIY